MIKQTIASCLCVLALTATQAQGSPQNQDHKRGDKKELREEKIKQDLGLTDEQAAQWKTIHDQHRSRMRMLKEDASMSDEDRKAQMKVLRSTTDDKLNAVLNSEQQDKWKAIKAERKGKRKGTRHQERPPAEESIGN